MISKIGIIIDIINDNFHPEVYASIKQATKVTTLCNTFPNLYPIPFSINIVSLIIREDNSPGLVFSCQAISCLIIANIVIVLYIIII